MLANTISPSRPTGSEETIIQMMLIAYTYHLGINPEVFKLNSFLFLIVLNTKFKNSQKLKKIEKLIDQGNFSKIREFF